MGQAAAPSGFRDDALDHDAEYVDPLDMLSELRDDKRTLQVTCAMRMICATSIAT